MLTRIRTAVRREEGASAVEYALLVAGIAALIVAAIFFIGRNVNSTFSKVGNSVTATS